MCVSVFYVCSVLILNPNNLCALVDRCRGSQNNVILYRCMCDIGAAALIVSRLVTCTFSVLGLHAASNELLPHIR